MDTTFLTINAIVVWVVLVFNLILTFILIRSINSQYSSDPTTRSAEDTSLKMLETGTVLPISTVQDLSGNDVSMDEIIKDNTFIVIVSPTCGPCKEALRGMELLIENKKINSSILMLGGGFLGDVQEMIDDLNITIPAVVTPLYGEVWEAYKLSFTPAYYIIDAQRTVQGGGLFSLEQFDQFLKSHK